MLKKPRRDIKIKWKKGWTEGKDACDWKSIDWTTGQ